MIYDIIFLLFIGVCSACFSYMLDYGLGKPGATDIDDVNERAFLFAWSLMLAKIKLTKYHNSETLNYSLEIPDSTNVLALRSLKKHWFAEGRDLFTWEFSFGMCIYCTNFWFSLIFATFILLLQPYNFVDIPNFFLFLTTPIFSHFILRKI